MFCNNCGKPLAPGELFCASCGARNEENAAQGQQGYPPQPNPYFQQEQFGGNASQYGVNQNQPAPQMYAQNPAPQGGGTGGDKNKLVAIIIAVVLVIAIAAGAALLVHFIKKENGITDAEETSITSTVKTEESTEKPEETTENEIISESTTEDEIIKKAKESNPDAEEFRGHAYAVFNYKDNELEDFNDCEEFCEEMGGHLAVIDSKEENDFLFEYLHRQDLSLAMFGYTDNKSEGKWKWVNGSDSGYTNWADGQPNNGANNRSGISENYAEFSKHPSDGSWNDTEFGSNTYNFICEWE